MESSPFSSLYELYNYLVATFKELGSFKWLFFGLITTHLLIGALSSPLVTSDFKRNLFYGEAFWKYGFRVYDLTPTQIDPEYKIYDPTSGILSYPNTTYDYPTIQLLFWIGVSILPYSEILGKWILSSFDILNFFLIYYLLKQITGKSGELELPEKGFTLSYLLFSMPFSAIEGQSTAITITFLLLPLVLHSRHKYWSYISIGLGFHWKYVSLLVLPYLLIKDRNDMKKTILGLFLVFGVISLLSFPILFSNFILNYFGFFGRLGDYSGQTPSNNLLIFHICISSLLSSGILVLAFFHWLGISISEKKITISFEGLSKKAYLIPFLILLIFLKIYPTAFPWYWMWFYPLITIFPIKENRLYTKLLSVTFAVGLIDFVDMTVGIEIFLGYFI